MTSNLFLLKVTLQFIIRQCSLIGGFNAVSWRDFLALTRMIEMNEEERAKSCAIGMLANPFYPLYPLFIVH
jgi:hypothetical protein